jgi:hypothetical protein
VAQPDDTAKVEVDSAPPARRRWVPWVIVAAVALLIALVLPVLSTLQPRYYERYPSLRHRMDGWRHSTHARMKCVDCHVDPGAANFLSFAARSVPAFYSQLIQGPSKTNLLRAPDRFACQKCHTTYRRVSPGGDLLIPHRAHVMVLNVNCVVCHKDLVHTKNARGFNRPEMQTCLAECHDGKKATNKCTKCHTRKQTPDSHSQPDWLQVHSTQKGKVNCDSCHGWAPDYCDKCHQQRPKSHTGNWKKNHQFRAKERGKGCLFCHGGAKFCKKCHD